MLASATLCALGGACASAATSVHRPDPGRRAAPVSCDRGQICFWSDENYRGQLISYDLRDIVPGECTTLPDGFVATSLANRSDRPLSVYADDTCDRDQGYAVYPGGGTFVPHLSSTVHAVELGD